MVRNNIVQSGLKILVGVLVAFVFLNVSSTCHAKAKTVLLLNSYSYDMQWTRSITEAISGKIAERQDVQILVEFLDAKRYPAQEYFDAHLGMLKRKYNNKQIDVVITSDDRAAQFALEKREELFPDTPLVFCGVNDTDFPKREDFINITGALEVPGFRETIVVAKQLFPATRKIYLVNESRTIGEGDRRDLQKILDSFSGDMESVWIEDKSAEEISNILSAIPEDSIVLLLSFFGDKGTDVFSIPEGAAFVSQQSKAPVFSMWDYFLGQGIVGGQLTSGTYQGYSAVQLALDIIDGSPADSMPVVSTSANQYMFDKHLLEKFGIANGDLPDGSVVINNPPSLYELYRYEIIAVTTVFFILLAVIITLAFSAHTRRVIELNLRKSEERLRLAMEANLDGLWDWDITTDEVYYSPGYIAMLGYTENDVKEHVSSWSDLIHPDDREKALQVNLDCIENRLSNFRVEFRMRGKDGQWRWILGRGSAVIRDENGRALRLIGTHTEITDRKIIEQELVQAKKMEAIGTLAGGIAHDFNNLLMGVQGRASLALLKLDRTGETREHLESILEYSNSAAELTRQLLGVARSGKYNLRATNINSIIINTTRMFARTKKELIITNELADDVWAVEVDRGQIEQVLLNLYVNAWQAMPHGGSLTVQTKNVDTDRAGIETLSLSPGKYVCIRVSDTGIGIEQELLDKIFEPFFTTKERSRGTGLGLASAYGIVKNHKGSIRAFSEVGQGTSFEIHIPVTSQEVTDEPLPDESITAGEGTILLVDDELMVLEVTSNILQEIGYQVYLARDGSEAIRLYSEHKDEIDLVMLDMIMPGLSGRETFNALKEIDEQVKVILSSGYSIDGQADEIMQNGCSEFIQKPFSIKDISLKIEKVLTG